MVDTIVNGTTHNVKSVFQNGVEYTFPGKTDEEYNELQNRYNQLLEDYNNKATESSGLRLYNNQISGIDDSPHTSNLVSFAKDGVLYGCCMATLEYYSSSSASKYVYGLYRWKKESNQDVKYYYTDIYGPGIYIGSQDGSSSSYINGDIVRVYFYEFETVSGGGYTYGVYKFDWNIKTNVCDASRVGSSQSPTSLYDLDGFSPLTGSSWVASATGNEIDDDAYIYLTLK